MNPITVTITLSVYDREILAEALADFLVSHNGVDMLPDEDATTAATEIAADMQILDRVMAFVRHHEACAAAELKDVKRNIKWIERWAAEARKEFPTDAAIALPAPDSASLPIQ